MFVLFGKKTLTQVKDFIYHNNALSYSKLSHKSFILKILKLLCASIRWTLKTAFYYKHIIVNVNIISLE